MATHKSAEKRARQAVKRNERNTQAVGAVRTLERKLRTAVASSDKPGATTLMNDYMSLMSKAGAKGRVHAKTASRKIGRLAARVSKIGTAAAVTKAPSKAASKTGAKSQAKSPAKA